MNIQELSQAWLSMHYERNCPSLKILRSNSKMVQLHLSTCPHCRERIAESEEPTAFDNFLFEAASQLTLESSTVISSGEIRRLCPEEEASSWFDERGRYFNPPLVLVLTEPNSHGWVKVAQIYEEAMLYAEGDIPLEDGDWGFAEAWNIYNVPEKLLSPFLLHQVDKKIVTAVLEVSEQDFPAISEDSPLYWFRVNELDTGSFFAMRANMQYLNELEKENTTIVSSWDTVRQFAAYVFTLPEQELAAAASANDTPFLDGEQSSRNVIVGYRNSREVEYVAADITRWADNGFTQFDIQCPFDSSLPDPEVAVQCARAKRDGEPMMDRKNGKLFLTVTFEGEDCRSEDLKIALLISLEK